MKKQISKILLITILVFAMAVPQFAFARMVAPAGTITPNQWTGFNTSCVLDGEWIRIGGSVGSAGGSSEGCHYNFGSGTTLIPEGSSIIYTVNFKTGLQPKSSSQACWFRLALNGNVWANVFQIKVEPGQPITLEFASNEEVRFNATDLDASNGMALDFDTEYTMKITLKPNVGTKVKFVAELYNAEGERIGAGMIDNYGFLNTNTIGGYIGLRLVSYRTSAITVLEPVCYVGDAKLEIDMPDSKPEATFFPENESDGADVYGDFYMNLPDAIEEIPLENVSISGGASVSSVDLSSNGKKLDFVFDNLKASTKYDVKIKGVKLVGSQTAYDFDWSFTTAHQVAYLPKSGAVILNDELALAEFVNFGADAVSGWSDDDAFVNGNAYSGNGSSVTSGGLDMVRQDVNGLIFSTAKLSGTRFSAKNTQVRKKFIDTPLVEESGLKMTFDFTTGTKIDNDFLLWLCLNDMNTKPFAYNAKDASITFASTPSSKLWSPKTSSDGKDKFELLENTDYSLVMEIAKNPVSSKYDMTLTLYDADGSRVDSASFESYADVTSISAFADITLNSQTNANCSGFDSVDYITVKNIKAEGEYEGGDRIADGDNIISIPWKNAFPEESFTSTFIAVTELTKEDVVSVDDINIIKFENVSGESGVHEIIVNVPDSFGKTLKIYAVNDVEGMIALSAIYELK